MHHTALEPCSVMLIEDEAILAMDLCNLLTEFGHEVIAVARTKAEALHHVQEKTPDLVICDVQLADQSSGIDATSQIRSLFGKLPVVFITAYAETVWQQSSDPQTVLVSKPFMDNELFSAMALALERRSFNQ